MARRYRVRARVAGGGMATVYRAEDTRLGRDVALKVMHPHLAGSPDLVARFRAEARAAASLSHRAVVAVHDQGEDGDVVWLAMELLPGRTLRDVLRERGALTPAEAFDVVEPLLLALAEAHRSGLVHRDVKPENVLVTRDGSYAVTDFGLARATTTDRTATGSLLGTPAYLAPETAQDGRVDARSDVYSAGVVLFELLTGRQPHTGEVPFQVVWAHVTTDVPPPSRWAPLLPPAVDQVVAHACRRDPARRTPGAAEMLAEVRRSWAALLPEVLDARPDPVGESPAAAPHDGATGVIPRRGATVAGTATLAPAAPRHDRQDRYDGHDADDGDDGWDASDRQGPDPGWQEVLRTHPSAAVRDLDPSPDAREHGWDGGDGAEDDQDGAAGRDGAAGWGGPTGRSGGQPWDRAGGGSRPSGATAVLPRRRRRLPGSGAVLLVLLLASLVAGAALWWTEAGPGAQRDVPDLRGRTAEAAAAQLDALGIASSTTPQPDEVAPPGEVVGTRPDPGRTVHKNGTVVLVVSSGPRLHDVPDLRGRTLAEATKALAGASLALGEVTEAFDPQVGAGRVVASTPPAGEGLRTGSPVALLVSRGPEPVAVPDLTGGTVAEARGALEADGLRLGAEDERYDDAPDGTVVAQDPEDGTLPPGAQVSVVVSRGPEPVEVPDVFERPFADAAAALEEAGLVVERRGSDVFGRVVSQDPAAGTAVPPGSTVVVTTF